MEKEELILIAEDDYINKQILKNLFADEYVIEEAANGNEALEIIEKKADRLAVIILDVYMPQLDGNFVLEKIVRNSDWQDIPVVIITSDNSLELEQSLLDLGACAIIHKPINNGIVKSHINNIIERSKKQKQFMNDYMLQRTLIDKTAHTFSCAYHFKDKSVNLDDEYREFFEPDFAEIFAGYPFKLDNFVLPKNLAAVNEFFDIQNKTKLYEEIELRIRVDSMHYEWFKVAVMIQCDAKGNRDNAMFLFTNIEYAVEAKNKLTFMAMNDVLTHIPNMRSFADDVNEMLKQYQEDHFAMITIDIGQFHLINKLFGYNEGDSVLKYFATKLQECVESYDKGVYCRMSSDIFYACISESDDIYDFVNTLQRVMDNYPIKFDIKLCFGIYQIKNREEAVDTMIDHASYARTAGKKKPKQSIKFYNTRLQEKEYFEAFVTTEMKNGLRSGQFEVYYQPKYSLKEEKIVGAEALIRWNHPERGFISPAIFVPIFEQNGFVTELDYFVYESVCKKLREWLDKGLEAVPISVNVSRCDLYDYKLTRHILEIVEKYQLPHNLIEFEITESAFILENKPILDFTQNLRNNGFRVLIDDFGSGYSSLNALKDINSDVLKIDIAFLPVSEQEIKSPIILAAIIEMAQKLGLATIAEGVETKEQVKLLTDLGCEQVQGFYFYRPMKADDFEKNL